MVELHFGLSLGLYEWVGVYSSSWERILSNAQYSFEGFLLDFETLL